MLLKNKKIVGFFIVLILPLSYIYEALPYHSYFSEISTKNSNLFIKKNLPDYYKNALNKVKSSKYQAIIPLPFFLNGSEWFVRAGTANSLKNTLILSYYTKIPILGAMLSRSSMTEAKKELQVLAPSFYYKQLAKDIKSRKPFLISYSNEPLTTYEQQLLLKADLVFKDSLINLYEITYKKLFEYNTQKEVDEYIRLKQNMFYRKGLYTTDTTGLIYYNNFDDSTNTVRFRGNGCFSSLRSGIPVIYEYSANTFDSNKEYIINFWFNNAKEERAGLFVCMDEFDPKENKGYWNYFADPRFCEIIVENWSLVEFNFKVYKSENTGKLFIDTRTITDDTIYIDDLLIREKNTNIYYPLQNYNKSLELFKNNHQIILNDTFGKKLINRENRILYYINQIKNSPAWLNNISIQAKNLKYSLEETIRFNAEYMAIMENQKK